MTTSSLPLAVARVIKGKKKRKTVASGRIAAAIDSRGARYLVIFVIEGVKDLRVVAVASSRRSCRNVAFGNAVGDCQVEERRRRDSQRSCVAGRAARREHESPCVRREQLRRQSARTQAFETREASRKSKATKEGAATRTGLTS